MRFGRALLERAVAGAAAAAATTSPTTAKGVALAASPVVTLHGAPFTPAVSGRLTGVVVAAKTEKTLKVHVDRTFIHPVVHKQIVRTTKLLCHDEVGIAKVGDTVEISPSRPISKRKHYVVFRVLRPAIDLQGTRQRKAQESLALLRTVKAELAADVNKSRRKVA